MGAVRIDQFIDPGSFKRRMDKWISFMRAARRAPGADRIWLPGEMEYVSRKERLTQGIPLNDAMIEELKTLAGEAGTDFTP